MTRVYNLQVLIFLLKPRKANEIRHGRQLVSSDFYQQENTIFLKLFYQFSVPFSDRYDCHISAWFMASFFTSECRVRAVRVQMDRKAKQRTNLSTISRVKRNICGAIQSWRIQSILNVLRYCDEREGKVKLCRTWITSPRGPFFDHEIDAQKRIIITIQ